MKTKTKTKKPCLSLQVYLAGTKNSASKKTEPYKAPKKETFTGYLIPHLLKRISVQRKSCPIA